MYCFVFRQQWIQTELQNRFISQIKIALNRSQIPVISSLSSNFILIIHGVDEIAIYLSNRQILLCSKNDFENGCPLTDLLVNQMLHFLGPLYTRIEQ